MKKKLLLLLVCIMTAVCGFGQATSGDCGANGDKVGWSFNISTGTLSINGIGEMANYSQTNNPAPWNEFKSDIKRIEIGDGVTGIGNDAFEGESTHPVSIYIPASVTSIYSGAFMNYGNNLNVYSEAVVAPTPVGGDIFVSATPVYASGNWSTVYFSNTGQGTLYILPNATGYDGARWLTRQIRAIPNSSDGLFYTVISKEEKTLSVRAGENFHASTLSIPSTVTVGNDVWSVTEIEQNGFLNHDEITNIYIPDNITSIGGSAFNWCTNLANITGGNGLTSIGQYAFHNFWGAGNLQHTAWYNSQPGGAIYIGKVLYYYKWSMSEGIDMNNPPQVNVDVIDGTLGIADGAFAGSDDGADINPLIHSITFPNSLIHIGKRAFNWCFNLTSITIPKSVQSIGDYAFSSCNSLTSIYAEAKVAPELENATAFSYYEGAASSRTLYLQVPNASGYSVSNGWPVNQVKAPLMEENGLIYSALDIDAKTAQVRAGSNFSSADLSALKQTVSYDGDTFTVTAIEANAFKDNQTLTSLVIPAYITSIGNSAFSGCSNLTAVTLPVINNFDVIFENCNNLTSLVISEDITSIPNNTFQNCSKLTSISIPNSVTTIGSNVFTGCSPEELVMPLIYQPLITEQLKKLTLSQVCTSIPAASLSACTNLEELTLPFIGTSADATGENAVLGAIFGATTSPTGITQYYDATNAKVYAIPATLKKLTVTRPAAQISYGALYNCTMLKEVTIGSSVQGLAEKAMFGCNGLTDIYSQWAYPPTAYNNNTFDGVNKYACTLHVPAGSKQYYSTADGWKEFFNIQEEAPLVITALAIPVYGGEISGVKQYNYEDEASLSAHGNMDYSFKGWMEDNTIVSVDPTYTFTVTAPRTLYAVFTPIENANTDIDIVPQAHSASITWIAVEDAASYKLIIYSDESRTNVIATFNLDVNGNIRSSQQTLSCTVPDLNANTQYYYSLTSYDAGNQALTILAGDFTTTTLDAINAISVSDPVISVQYYDLLGNGLAKPLRGSIYIVKEVHQSGKVEVKKEILK